MALLWLQADYCLLFVCECVKKSNIQNAADILSELEQKLDDSGEGGP